MDEVREKAVNIMNRSERYQKMVEPELTHLNLRWEDISQQIRVRSFKVKFLVFYSTSYIVYMYVSLFPVLINFLFHWPFFHENQLGREVFIFTLLLCQKCGYGGFHIIHSQKKYLGRFLFDFFTDMAMQLVMRPSHKRKGRAQEARHYFWLA